MMTLHSNTRLLNCAASAELINRVTWVGNSNIEKKRCDSMNVAYVPLNIKLRKTENKHNRQRIN